jgi:alditol oxidase
MAIHFTWKPEWQAVKALLPQIEEKLKPFDARPHWAKLFTMAPSRLQAQYGKLNNFRDLMKSYDPDGKFRNGFIDTNLYPS